MSRAARKALTDRAERRRWMHYQPDRLQALPRGPYSAQRYASEPTYRFCLTDMRLTILYWLLRVADLAQNRRWAIASHNCSCYYCRGNRRRYQGNSPEGWSHAEKRLRSALHEEESAPAL